MAEFRINDHAYRSRKLNARQQLHVMRRLAPIIGPISVLAMMETANVEDPQELQRQIAMTMPSLEAFAHMSDEDVNYVLDVCLAACQRQSGGNGSGQTVWSDVWNVAARREMFDDLDMGEMIQIVWNVVQDSIRGFSSIRPVQPVAPNMVEPAQTASSG